MNGKKEAIYKVEPWCITESGFSPEYNYRNETTFALSNGYIGTRGTLEEGYDFNEEEGLEGNFINGFYESEEVRYGEWNFGFPEKSQSLLNVCNAKTMSVWLDDERLDIRAGELQEYKRTLDLRQGIVERQMIWVSPQGRKLQVKTRRLVSLTDKNLMAVQMELCPLSGSEEKHRLRVESLLETNVENHTRKTNPLVDYGPFGKRLIQKVLEAGEAEAYYEGETLNSKLTMACGTAHKWSRMPEHFRAAAGEEGAVQRYEWTVGCGEKLVIEKMICYTTSLDLPVGKLRGFAEKRCREAADRGFEELLKSQTEYMHAFWESADVEILGNDSLLQGMRFNLFHMMQAAGRDGTTGMGAKGLTGEGYEGHYFWDTETYVLPVFVYTWPTLARSLLDYRYHTLNQARERARVLGHEKGALYPWRTINGQEASTYFPLGTAQYHINGDIAYAFWQYLTVTGDQTYLERAAEVLCETARVYADVGCFADCVQGRYCICSVTGPDEYNAIVDNNFYTNLMARENLRYALCSLDQLREYDSAVCDSLINRLKITQEELALWQEIIHRMYLPYEEALGIYPQDDGFLKRKPWDESRIPPEKRHLLYENYHPLFIYRQRMSKQADTVLGMYLHSNYFTAEQLKRNYDFYQNVTLHHSSLSTCIFGIVACETGDYQDACLAFSQSARMDLDDYHENFYAGIHAANMAGTWQFVINGFAGLRTNGGNLCFRPFLPEDMEGYRFRIGYRGRTLEVTVKRGEARFLLVKGKELSFVVNGKSAVIKREGGYYVETI